ncbi:phage tail tape measure protein [Alcaligenaceae bacterium]|nr:phage tail tape measure protein [Alcaligenaceae bacterium]
MARDIEVGLRIGAAVSGSVRAALGSVRGTVQQLGRVTDSLTTKQQQIGSTLSAAVASGAGRLATLRAEYDRVGRTIDQLKVKQDQLNGSIARGEALASQRKALRGQALEVIGTATVIGAPLVQALRSTASFQDQTTDIAITGGFSQAEEARLGNVLRQAAKDFNQFQGDVAAGAQILIAGGIENVDALSAYAPVLSKTATATRASMADLGNVALALNDNLGVGAEGYERALNMLAYAGKRGQFELADMAKHLPNLTPMMYALGITGERAVAEIGASLQIARRGAGSNDEAANNYKNFLTKITSSETLKSFEDAGIVLQNSMRTLVSQGLTPTQAMLEVINNYVSTKGPEAAKQFQQVMRIKDETEQQAALDRLNEAYKLGELFRDMQVLSYVRPALAFKDDLADIQRGSVDAADKGVLDEDFERRMQGAREQFKLLAVNMAEASLVLGSTLLPAVVDIGKAALPAIQAFSEWAAQHPGLIKGVVAVTAGLLGAKLAIIGVQYGFNLLLSPLYAVRTGVLALSAKWTLMRGMFQLGHFTPVVNALRLVGQTVVWLGNTLLTTPIGLAVAALAVAALLVYRYWEPIKGFFSGLWDGIRAGFAPVMAALQPGLDGLRAGFDAILSASAPLLPVLEWMFTPTIAGVRLVIGGVRDLIGWIGGLFTPVEDVGGAARNMGELFGQGIASALTGLAGLVGEFLLLPARLLQIGAEAIGSLSSALTAGLTSLGAELPARFSELGSGLMRGLIGGITSMGLAVRDSIVGMGDSVTGWFREKLGINSPSRVFMGLGAEIPAGAALGIRGEVARVGAAVQEMADLAAGVDMPGPPSAQAAAWRDGGGAAVASGAAGGAAPINFAPVIHIDGGRGDVRSQVDQALRLSLDEFARLMERYQHAQGRASYGSL